MTEENKDAAPPEKIEKSAEDQIVVVEEAAAPPAEKKSEPQKGELEEYSESVNRRINKLTAKLREAERRENAALEFAKSVQGDYNQLQERSKTVDTSYVQEFDGRVKAQENALKHNLKVALTNGDADAIADINARLAELAVDKYRLAQTQQQRETDAARAKEADERRRADDELRRQQPPQQQQRPAAPDPRALKWADDNTWFGQDQPMTLTAFSIHKTLVEEEGVDPSTEQYFQEIDRRMREQWPHKFQQNGQQKTFRSPVAPANNQVTTQTSKKEIKLSPSQVAIAKKLGVSVESYARQVAKLQKERS